MIINTKAYSSGTIDMVEGARGLPLEAFGFELLKNPKFRKLWEKHRLARQVSEEIIKLRVEKKLSQKELADLIGSKQPAIARVENGEYLPSLSWLGKVAKKTKTKLIVRLERMIK